MNLDKFKHQHTDILRSITTLRALAHAGVEANATAIAQGIVAMSGTIKLHLAVEDQVLYPALQRGGNVELARLGRQYQSEMASIASAYEANVVLRRVFERMQREDHDFYPRIEEDETAACH